MKFYVTLPSLPHKHFVVDAKDRINACCIALAITTWTEEEWNDARTRTPDYETQEIDTCGNLINKE